MDLGYFISYLIEFIASKMDLANLLGLIGAIFYVASMTLRTMIPLRIAAIISNILFMGYGLLAKALPTFIMYAVLLPINVFRLYQIQQLVKRVKVASQGDLDMEWLKPFMTKKNFRKGDVLFHKGDVANAMYFTVTGKFLVKEFGVELPPGRVMGELGFLAPDNKRTATVECIEDGQVLFIIYDKVRELYFQDPDFGFYFLKLTSERLLQNIARLEGEVEVCKSRIRELEAAANAARAT
ncbi:Crp/Fnr family transcriptional regulator [Pseudorhodoplanes sp.]|uniref:Crp/Fnr family transcriptional regulator n=1 Tax=Pseudorhodoplanes sp. TaxID=1934341 RepID=UPI00391B3145